MLNSDDRRPAFDAFFASLDAAAQTVFMDEALNQHATLLECEPDHGSVIDCMENVWDRWRELDSSVYNWNDDDHAIVALMADPARRSRQRAYYNRHTPDDVRRGAEFVAEAFGVTWEYACNVAETARDHGLVISANATHYPSNPAVTVQRDGATVGAVVFVGTESGYLAAIAGDAGKSGIRWTIRLAILWIASNA